MKFWNTFWFLVVAAVAMRLLPHAWNMVPLAAFALFAGANHSPRIAWLLPLVALLISDLFIGFYDVTSMVFVYLGFLLTPFIGHFLLKDSWKSWRFGAAVGGNALVFFIVSNFGVWLGGYYGLTFEGLVATYVAALPFLKNSLLADAVFTFALFAIFDFARSRTGLTAEAQNG